jgi:hydrogen peroxide-dependent heme synthase
MIKKFLDKLINSPLINAPQSAVATQASGGHSSTSVHSSSTGSAAVSHPHSGGRPDSSEHSGTGGRPGASRAPVPEASVTPEIGKHVGHYLYRFRRDVICDQVQTSFDQLPSHMSSQLIEALDSKHPQAPERLSSYWISGHRADFAVMAIDDDPAKVDSVHQRLMKPNLGKVLEPTWSFISMTEISEYVPSVEEFREKLIREGADPQSPELAAKVSGYERRLPIMNASRLCPEVPDWPAACFYPMNKVRHVGANWFTEPFSHRRAMMSEHAESGMEFAGRVSQLISVGVGLDDWEWMVTLWGRNPQYLKDIVYRMRFDIASAKYAEFGPFYVGYKATAQEILKHCRLG